MCQAVFVTPNYQKKINNEPIGTLLLATIANNAGIPSKLLPFHRFGDARDFDRFVAGAAEQILACQPRIVSFYTRCDTYHVSIRIAQEVKRARRDVYTVFGGPQADITAVDTLRGIPEIDYVCRGEGETTIVPFFASLIAGQPDHSIPGLVYREGDAIRQNPRPELIGDLNTLPVADYSLLDDIYPRDTIHPNLAFPIDVGRGCPFSCTFCSTKSFWDRKYRLKSAEAILAEIRQIHDHFGLTSFIFEHDMFTMDRERVIRICEKLKDIGFPITWGCSARLDCLDEELVGIMASAGMKTLYIGMETGSQQMQRTIRKNLNLEGACEKLSRIASGTSHTTVSFIYGFPEETEETFDETVAMMVRLSAIPNVQLQHHLCAFYSGTELTQRYSDALTFTGSAPDGSEETGVRECAGLISANPAIFPQFYDYTSPLRDKIRYFPVFFDCWLRLRPVFEYIACHRYEHHYFRMLCDFSADNSKALGAGRSAAEVLRQDRFLERFRDDPNHTLITEILRYTLWKNDPKSFGREVFGFDIRALDGGKPLARIPASITMAAWEKDPSGNRKLRIYG